LDQKLIAVNPFVPLIGCVRTAFEDTAMPASPDQMSFTFQPENEAAAAAFEEARKAACACRACHLWEPATQTVFGEGPVPAPVMLIGEQPGDKEDLAGRPFVGPAGFKLNEALNDVGISRQALYITNAVKHFKYVPRGRIRLHQKPVTAEIKACRSWLERELELVRPKVAAALGATAAQSLFGKAMPVNKNRGRLFDLGASKVIITIHPSYLLRIEDPAEADAEYDRFVSDLKLLRPYLG
jgi:uracil-DNA glycosylase